MVLETLQSTRFRRKALLLAIVILALGNISLTAAYLQGILSKNILNIVDVRTLLGIAAIYAAYLANKTDL